MKCTGLRVGDVTEFRDPLIAMAVWAVVTMALSPLPWRRQIIPGAILLLAFVPLLIWTGLVYGFVPVVIALVAAVSIFRKPLRALSRRVWGCFKCK